MHIDVYKGSEWKSRVYGSVVDSNISNSTPKITVTLNSGRSDCYFTTGYENNSYTKSTQVKLTFLLSNLLVGSGYSYVLDVTPDQLSTPTSYLDNNNTSKPRPRGYVISSPPAAATDPLPWRVGNYDDGDAVDGTAGSPVAYTYVSNNVFSGWSYNSRTYIAGDTLQLNVNSSIVLTATWNTNISGGSVTTVHFQKPSSISKDGVSWVDVATVQSTAGSLFESIIQSAPTMPSNTRFICWMAQDGRTIYSSDYIPCGGQFYVRALFEPINITGSNLSASFSSTSDSIVLQSPAVDTKTDAEVVNGTAIGKLRLVKTSQANNKTKIFWCYSFKVSPSTSGAGMGTSWRQIKLDLKLRKNTSSDPSVFDQLNYEPYRTDKGIVYYLGYRGSSSGNNYDNFSPLSEEYKFHINQGNTGLVAKSMGTSGEFEIENDTAPDPQTGIATISVYPYVLSSRDVVAGGSTVGSFWSDLKIDQTTPWVITYDCNVRYYRNYSDSDETEYSDYRQIKVPGQALTLRSTVPEREGYIFKHWALNRSSITYDPSDVIPADNNQTGWNLYAVWEQIPDRELIFDPNGGTVTPTSKTVRIGQAYGELPTPTRENYLFSGWYTLADGGSKVDEDKIMEAGDYSPVTIYAHWTPEWDYTVEDIEFLCHNRPKLYISAKRYSLEKPSNVVLCMFPELAALEQKGTTDDRNFVGNTFRIEYRQENRQDSNWTSGSGTVGYADRRDYSNPEYPTWQTFISSDDGPVLTNSNGAFRTDVKSASGRTKFAEFDIDKEWQLRARIDDALRYGSDITYDIPTDAHQSKTSSQYTTADYNNARTGKYVLYTSDSHKKILYSNDKWCIRSLWSNAALLLKYITKLFVHNPFLDEVLKESRIDKQHRQVQNPLETDYWQIREHTQNSRNDFDNLSEDDQYSILVARSDSRSENGFNRGEIDDYAIPTFINGDSNTGVLEDDTRLVYDASQMQKLVKLLNKINPDHAKIIQEVLHFGDLNSPQEYSSSHSLLEVGDLDAAEDFDNKDTTPHTARILDLDGERHGRRRYFPEDWNEDQLGMWGRGTEKNTYPNRLRDTEFQKVELYDFDKTAESDASLGTNGTIDHIYNYDINQIDLERSLSDLLYMLSRMRTRQPNSEGKKSDMPSELTGTNLTKFNSYKNKETAFKADTTSKEKLDDWIAAREALDAVIGQFIDIDTESNFKDEWFTNWKPSGPSWNTEENPYSEYTDLEESFPDNFKPYTVFKSSYSEEYENNGCKAACMGLCQNSCYSSCVGGCNTACGSGCFGNCTETCMLSCLGVCSESCNVGCWQECSSGCGNGCGSQCTSGCGGACSTSCGSDCKQNCAEKCTGACTTGCKNGCKEGCKEGCKNNCGPNNPCKGTCTQVCADACYGECNNNCGGACKKVCQGSCGSTCSGTCLGGCVSSCMGCGNECTTTCSNTCGRACGRVCTSQCSAGCSGTCDANCAGECTGYCSRTCSGDCDSRCQTTCTNTCGIYCSHQCKQNCNVECQDICGNGCTQNCSSACKETCSEACRVGCASNCETGCKTYCAQMCRVSCKDECSTSCATGCYVECQQGCKKNCTRQCIRSCTHANMDSFYQWSCPDCTTYCSGQCNYTCGSECSTDCYSACTKVCYNTCSSACTIVCYIQCKDNCSIECTDQCKSTCNNCCQDVCSSCSTNCRQTCQSVCKGTCGGNCSASCNNGCSITCEDGCAERCTGTCTASCGTGCASGCTGDCKGECYSSCWSTCNFACTGQAMKTA